MSFAYIDSQGKEVPIPGPDALRLRIELGAITDATQFYDAGSDRWAPASEHEIYRQLKRDISSSQSNGFTVPPPSTIGPEQLSDDDLPAEPVAEDVSSIEPGEVLKDADAFEPWDPEPPASGGVGQELDEIVAAGADDDPSHEELFYPQGASAEELDDGMDGFTLADLDAPVIVDDDDPPVDHEDVSEATGAAAAMSEPDIGSDDDGGFDFGFGALEVEEEEEVVAHESADAGDGPEAAEDGTSDDEPMGSLPAAAFPAPVTDDDTPDFGMAFEGGAPDDDFETATAVDEDDAGSSDGSPDGSPLDSDADSSDGAGADGPYHREIRERRGPRSKPPRRPGDGGGAGRWVAILVGVVVIAGGAWFITRGSDGEGSAPAPVVALPDLPAELEPQLRTIARSASQATVAEFDSIPSRLALAPEPAERWLSGAYLANASAFPGVSDYWTGVGEVLDEMIATEDGLWEAALERALDAASVAPDAEAPLRNRALAGWAAAAPARQAVHDELRGIVDASLELHAFLLRNEESITYSPGTGGGAGDPVLEAVPETPALGDEMWDLVGDITVALDALGYLQQVETESLMERVKDKLVATGFR